ncbi:MAG: hypothetical protein M3Q52_01470, partial [Pseudomonadota bacterium]|nr:hypothetical protein [Pseudomonadota bacterium]
MADSLGQLVGAEDAPPALRLDRKGPSRLPFGGGGRAHVDRALPFLILNRQGEPDSLAARITAISPSYVLWPDASDAEALSAIEAITHAAHRAHPRLLLVSLYDLPRDQSLDPDLPKLEAFDARLSASADGPAQAAATRLTGALESIAIDLRTCRVEPVADAWFEPGVEELVLRLPYVSHISLGLPQTYRVPGKRTVYPQLMHELEIGIFDALLQAAHAFLAELSPEAPASHRALGRRSFIDAARSVDRKLLRVSTSFDFLLSVSPINSEQAFDQFKADKAEKAPLFRYRP